jgi:hypothetical protein
MDIEHRGRPLGPPEANFNGGQQAYQRAFKQHVKKTVEPLENTHRVRMSGSRYDQAYRNDVFKEKRQRQARNVQKQADALQRRRLAEANSGLPRMPTPEPPEDSGEELWDWTNRGPLYIRDSDGEQTRAFGTGGYRKQQTQRHRVHGMDKAKVVLQEVGGAADLQLDERQAHNVHGIETRMRIKSKIEIETKLPRSDATRVPISIRNVIFRLVYLANDASGGELKMNARRLSQSFH